ncbi:maleate cis-trans isomerase [Aeropyrum pernix K1]|uniref:Maleate cis-trans isomerase n=1 Tax=Aeropyrum pernix (strain ATCC 700893 / DSM 11879 / JCM 9820 / NBRC 100138 / K1) TaxID=272557 RepID=Q9Y8W4_AERPE|nr:aspartate/glutamate racemase family protein [Aeropyrum pernix]BAA81536.2 maleate cis-trans isomerase [Aeropyrum pernix K1]
MYGWRARIGLIVPSSNTTMEPEMWMMAPEGVSIHTGRVPLEKVSVEELLKMEEYSAIEAEKLATAGVDLIVYGCTTGSLIGGPGYDLKIADKLSSASGVQVVTTATAVVEALKALGASRIAVATPYIEEVNKREEEFLRHHGFDIVDFKSLGLLGNLDIGRVPPWRVYRLARSLSIEGADAIFISCTNLRTVEVIGLLERDTGLPVVSSNTASMWMALKTLGIREAGFKAGTIFSRL